MNKINWTSQELSSALSINSKKIFSICKISIDSNLIKNNDLFIPIKGKNFNGHQFIPKVLKNNNNYSLADKINFKKFKLEKFKERIIFVKNSTDALNNIAAYSRHRFKGKILGITGSVGKTSLKEAIDFILKKEIKLQSNIGNYNNLIGMPLSLVNFRQNLDLGILELGMNKVGEIKKLSNISKPDIALITKISSAHIGNFKSLKEIAIEKSEIFFGMDKSGIVILNHSDPYFSIIKQRAQSIGIKNFIFFGKSNKCDVKLLKIDQKKNNQYKIYVDAMGKKINFILNNLGEHWIENTLAIISFLLSINSDLFNFSNKIKNFTAVKGRGQILNATLNNKKFNIIDDSYNSSPESLSSSILFLNHYGYNKRKICVLGDMLELGKFSRKFHLDLKKNIKDNKIFKVYTIGNEMKNLYDSLPLLTQGAHSKNLSELFLNLKKIIKSQDVVLIKGSRSMKLDKIINKFK